MDFYSSPPVDTILVPIIDNLFILTEKELSHLDARLKPAMGPAEVEVMVGSSSEDIRLKGKFRI